MENICSQGGEWASRFANQEVVFSLVQIYNAGRGEHLKATTASTLARLLRHSPALVGYMVDKFGVRLMVSGLGDTSSKVQTAAVNMLNLALSHPELSTRAKVGTERGWAASCVLLLCEIRRVHRSHQLNFMTLHHWQKLTVTNILPVALGLQAALAEERSLVPALMALLDHALPLLRAKGVVAVLLLCR